MPGKLLPLGFAFLLTTFLHIIPASASTASVIDRHAIVSRYNPTRNASSPTTPMQVGNGHFAFGADVTGLQTFLPFAIMSDWGWKNDSLPPGRTWQDVEDYEGVQWDFHGRPVQYEFDGEPLVQQWLISNPNRVNLGRVGLLFLENDQKPTNVSEADLTDIEQSLNLWTGIMTSQFKFRGQPITVTTVASQSSSAVGVNIQSPLLQSGKLGIYFDFPWNDGSQKFSAPFVGSFNATSNHTTSLRVSGSLGRNVQASIEHTLVASTFLTSIGGDPFVISRDSPSTHRYSVHPSSTSKSFSFTVAYSSVGNAVATALPLYQAVVTESTRAWEAFWSQSGFVDVFTGSSDPRADELQRRIILSRYLMRVNEAGETSPQEVCFLVVHSNVTNVQHEQSGLVNNGWVRLESEAFRRGLAYSRLFTVREVPHGAGLLAPGTLGVMEQLGSSGAYNGNVSSIPSDLDTTSTSATGVRNGCALVEDDGSIW